MHITHLERKVFPNKKEIIAALKQVIKPDVFKRLNISAQNLGRYGEKRKQYEVILMLPVYINFRIDNCFRIDENEFTYKFINNILCVTIFKDPAVSAHITVYDKPAT